MSKKMTIYDLIAKANPKTNKGSRENIRGTLIKIGTMTNRPEMVAWAKGLNDEGLEMCLHLGFSEEALLQSLSGTFELRPFGVKKKE